LKLRIFPKKCFYPDNIFDVHTGLQRHNCRSNSLPSPIQNSSYSNDQQKKYPVKVMQTLYTLDSLDDLSKPGEPQRILQQHFSQTRSLLVYFSWFLTEVARYAETESHKRASKHLPSTADLNVNTKIAGNEVLWKMLEDAALKEQFEKEKPQQKTDPELIRKIYLEMVETADYKTYAASPSRDKQEERKILEFILNDLLLGNELFVSHIEEIFSNWNDDGEMLVQLLVGYIQNRVL
jgi:N utilization substance protein B